MDRKDMFVYIRDMIRSFFDPGLQLVGYGYVALNDVSNRWNCLSWSAPFWRVYWNNAPGATLRLGKRQTMPLRPDHLYVIPPNVDFGSSHKGHCRQLYVHFQIRHPYALCGPPVIVLPLTHQRRLLVRRIIAGHSRDPASRQRTAFLLNAFIEILIADLTKRYLKFRDINKTLLNALTYLEQHLAHSISNQKLAATMHAHPRTMLRLFKTGLGLSPQSYLRQLRVDKARWLLRFSNEPIKAIAAETGFCDRYHFTKIFTTLTYQSPARFRDYNA